MGGVCRSRDHRFCRRGPREHAMQIAESIPTLAPTALAVHEYVDSLSIGPVHDVADLALQPTPSGTEPPTSHRPIHVRPFTQEDAQAFLEAVHESVDTVGRWLPWCHAGYSLDDASTWMSACRTFWEAGHGYNFAVIDDLTGEFLGSVGIDRIDLEHFNANIGYWIKASAAGQGVAPAAVGLILPFAFFELKLNRLEIVALCHNLPSIRVAEKVGAQFECVARHRLTVSSQPCDAAIFSLVPNDVWPVPQEEAGP